MANFFEKILSVKGYPIGEAKGLLKKFQSRSADGRDAWQENKQWNMLLYHYKWNGFYRDFIGGAMPERWEDIPIITKADLQKPLSELVPKNIDLKKCYKGSTSGSTGTPFSFAKDKLTHAMTWAYVERCYQQWGVDLQSKQARFYGMPKEFAANKKELLKDKLMNRERFNVFDLSDEVLQRYLERFERKRFEYLYGYTSALVMFARYLIARNVVLKDVCSSLKLCICTSETCSVEDKKVMEQGFGVPIVREYGLSEACIVAFDTDNGWLLNDDTLYTEVVDGQIVVTSLFNTAMPMIRYATGDMGTITDRDENGYRYVKELTGRTNDTVLLPNGRKAAGLSFYYVARSVLEQTDVLKEFIIRQTAINKFEFDVVAARSLSDAEQELLKNKTRDYLSADVEVVVHQVKHIQRPESGKLKHFYSEISE